MTSKYQKREFPKSKLGKLTSISYRDNTDLLIETSYSSLKIRIVNGQLCFYKKYPNGDEVIMPLIRVSRLLKLLEKETCL